jgi:hypothetical protein
MLRRLLTVCAALATFAIAGCDDDPEGPQTTRLRVQNNAAESIFEVYFSACSDATWGNDRLGATETIDPSESREWDVTPGCWDVLLVTESAAEAEFTNQNIDAGETHTVVLTN